MGRMCSWLLRLVCVPLQCIVLYNECNIVGAEVVTVLGTALDGTLVFGNSFLGDLDVLHSLGDDI